ncbi:MAG: hypothetical protein R2788_21100 [Saprospiraceae bacterium]
MATWASGQASKSYTTDNEASTFTCPNNMQVEVGANCKGTVVLPQITDIQDCSQDIDVFINTNLGVGTGPFTNVNLGNYTATYTVFDVQETIFAPLTSK